MHQVPERPHALGHGHVLAFLALWGLATCEPKLVVGTWSAAGEAGQSGQEGGSTGQAGEGGRTGDGGQAGDGLGGDDGACVDDGAMPSVTTDPLSVPWSTSFEGGFCDFQKLAGYCFADGAGSYELVESPVRSGKYAAAFKINPQTGYQARCVAQGQLPEAAYYGAWYYVPSLTTNNSVWNLLHFQGGDPLAPHGLWDVSLRNGTDGSLEVFVLGFLNNQNYFAAERRPIPIGAWFHLEFYLRRAADDSGEMALYQDGQWLVGATGLVTDDTDWGQWFVGNIANALIPPDSTVYVDDITIGTSRIGTSR